MMLLRQLAPLGGKHDLRPKLIKRKTQYMILLQDNELSDKSIISYLQTAHSKST